MALSMTPTSFVDKIFKPGNCYISLISRLNKSKTLSREVTSAGVSTQAEKNILR